MSEQRPEHDGTDQALMVLIAIMVLIVAAVAGFLLIGYFWIGDFRPE